MKTISYRVNITQTLEVTNLKSIINLLKHHLQTKPFDTGDPDCKTVLEQLFLAYQESHESEPPDIANRFIELDALLGGLPLEDNNTVFRVCCNLCTALEQRAFIDGIHYGAHLMMELNPE